jgi:UDP-N-acetyl-D-glucosamine dehydrogenase
MTSTSLDRIPEFDCVLIATDHTQYDYRDIVSKAQLVVDTRNATKGITAANIVRC